MDANQRGNQVRIVEEEYGDSGQKDFNGRDIVHAVSIVRVSDGTVLGKYRETEHVQIPVEKKDSKGKVVKSFAEKEISGIEAAKAACGVNGWKIAKY